MVGLKHERIIAPLDQAHESSDSSAKLKVDDHVTVQTKNGNTLYLQARVLNDQGFVGMAATPDHKVYHLRYSDLAELKIDRWGPGVG